MQTVQVFPSFNNKNIKALWLKLAAMTPNSALCSVVVDEVTLKEQVTCNKEGDQVERVEDRERSENIICRHSCHRVYFTGFAGPPETTCRLLSV